MMSFVARSSSLSPHFKVVSQAVASQLNPVIPPIVYAAKKDVINVPFQPETSEALKGTIPHGRLRITSYVTATTQVRFAHTDINVPDFSDYRRKSVMDPTVKSSESADGRRAFTYVMVAASGMSGMYIAKTMVYDLVSSMSASADVLALAKIEVKLDSIPEGKNMTVKWRGKPLFVRHRTADEIDAESKVSLANLRDPQHDHERTKKPEWLIVLGVCTHLGCVPIANSGDFGGYYCPCHGSHYDSSGRIRKGPAPLNLEVPPHEFVDDNTLVVG